MPYEQQISREYPSCILFLIDQSQSMGDAFGGDPGTSKADGVATAVNRLFKEIVNKCTKNDGVRRYYDLGAVGYGGAVGSAFGSALSGRGLVPVNEVAENVLRVETRVRVEHDNVGGLIEEEVVFDVWFDPRTENGTPMCAAFNQAHTILAEWIGQHPDSFPPIVINITDGESTDGDPISPAAALRSLATSDGNVLLFNIHLSSLRNPPIQFPDDEVPMPDQYAALLYAMSSQLPPHIQNEAGKMGYHVSDTTRGFVFNADLTALIRALNVGTRSPNALR